MEQSENRNFTKWVAVWGNATSISDRREAVYAKNITLRYPLKLCFNGSKIRFHFSNLTGTEPVTITKCCFAEKNSGSYKNVPVTFGGKSVGNLLPSAELLSDEIPYDVKAGTEINVSLYFADFTQLNAGTLVTGPLSKGEYSYGDFCESENLPVDLTRPTNWFYFLNTIDVFTEEKNHALICYGDSITAQAWPDYLALRCAEKGFNNVSIIRRAVCGTRILRQYDCITYQAYGLKGETRFPIETAAAGADTVIVQHGINDIIHPVGVEVNKFRPWSDMPTLDDMKNGVKRFYIDCAKKRGQKIWSGTLLPIFGWRTYNEDRNRLRNDFNSWLRSEPLFDGCVDFEKAVRDGAKPESFASGFDSGDHLHPSEKAYKAMAECVPEELLK